MTRDVRGGGFRGTRWRVKLRAWAPFAAACAVAVARAVLASPPEQPPPDADESLLHAAFRAVASDEAAMRHDAAKDFPTDLWSRDDNFHERELRKARDWAGKHRVRLGLVLSAVDQGLRSAWPHDNRGPLTTTVPPCRPRAIY